MSPMGAPMPLMAAMDVTHDVTHDVTPPPPPPTRPPPPPHYFPPPRHDVAEVAGLTSFSFGDDEDSRYVMVFKKVRGGGRQ